MPYFITDDSEQCSGWAVVKQDGEVMGCHTTKEDAISQMVAISQAEGIEPGGERALPDNYRPALADDVPEGRPKNISFSYWNPNSSAVLPWNKALVLELLGPALV